MKKLVRLLSVLALASTVAFVSCKGDKGDIGLKGEVGAKGEAGKDGKNGVANIKPFTHTAAVNDWKEVDRSLGGSSSKWGGVSVANANIKENMTVLAFYVATDGMKQALPITLYKSMDKSVEMLDYAYDTGKVSLYYKRQTELFDDSEKYQPITALGFKFLAFDEAATTAMRTSGVNLSSYNEVVNFANKNQIAPVQL